MNQYNFWSQEIYPTILAIGYRGKGSLRLNMLPWVEQGMGVTFQVETNNLNSLNITCITWQYIGNLKSLDRTAKLVAFFMRFM